MNKFIQETACDNCPFNESGPGRVLRDSLAPGRFEEIQNGLLDRQAFFCHKTAKETGTGKKKVCAGALAFQRKNNCVPNELQIIERIQAMRGQRKARW